jgi:S1-C subfamily serine protease
MKRALLPLLFLTLTVGAHAQVSWQDIYAVTRESVVVVRSGLRVETSPSEVLGNGVLRQLDSMLAASLETGYFEFSSGTGLVVSNDGYVITNQHVVEEPEDLTGWITFTLYSLRSQLGWQPGNSRLTDEEINEATEDLRSVLQEAVWEHRIQTVDGRDFPAQMVFAEERDDLALLRTPEIGAVRPAPLAVYEELTVGDDVAAVGFPYEGEIQETFDSIEPTLSVGIVSALRGGNRGVQHTASLSPGNSGGPLLDRNGQVVGINVSRFYGGEALQFAIPSSVVLGALERQGYSGIVDENRVRSIALGKADSLNPGSEVVVDQPLVLETLPGLPVAVDGRMLGETPLTIDGLQPGIHSLEIVGEVWSYRQEVVVAPGRGLRVLAPRLSRRTGTLSVTSVPESAGAYLDGAPVGRTPLTLADLAAGEHVLHLREPGFYADPLEVRLPGDTTVSTQVVMEEGYPFILQNLPDGVAATFHNAATGASFSSGSPTHLSAGAWELELDDPRYRPERVSVSIPEDGSFDARGLLRQGTLVIHGLDESMTLTISGEINPITSTFVRVELPVGSHEVVVDKPDYDSYDRVITIRASTVQRIRIDLTRSSEYVRRFTRRRVYPVAAAGLGLAAGGFILNNDNVSMQLARTYEGYVGIKLGTVGAIAAGGALLYRALFLLESETPLPDVPMGQ